MIDNIKKALPYPIYIILSWFIHPISHIKQAKKISKERREICKSIKLHELALRKIKEKDQITCVFLALFDSVWKYDNVYNELQNNSRFKLIVLVCPIVNYGYQNMLERMDKCYLAMKKKGYNVIKAYDPKTKIYIDLRKDLHPDLLFYTNPYYGLIDHRYYITGYPDILSIYVPYHFGNSNDYQVFNNLLFHNLVWRNYVETEEHKHIYCKYEHLKGKNVKAVGYPGIEPFLKEQNNNIYKNTKKTIIWAPHHTIEPVGKVNFSCFIKYSEFMIDMAKKFEDKVMFVFKPHPLLRNKLNLLWGKDKTDAYYLQWETMPNTSINEGEYVDLFLKSDAMIHDSGSFLTEYLYTHKPVMRTMNDVDPKTMYNDFALDVLDVYYKAYNEQDIEQFIQNVIDGVDPMKEAREKFYQERLLPPNGKLPSENIVNDIIDSINNQRVLAE